MVDINTVVVGKAYGIMSKGQKVKVTVTKVNKRAGTVDIKNAAGKALAGVSVDKLKGLQGRPPADAKPAAAPKAAPKPAPAAPKAAAPAKASVKNAPSYADLIERQRDAQNRLADAINELADITDALAEMEPAEAAPAPKATGKGRSKPMADEADDADADEEEIDFD